MVVELIKFKIFVYTIFRIKTKTFLNILKK
jgi:hypothetical protein